MQAEQRGDIFPGYLVFAAMFSPEITCWLSTQIEALAITVCNSAPRVNSAAGVAVKYVSVFLCH